MSEHKIKREKTQEEKDRWEYLKHDLLKIKGTNRLVKPKKKKKQQNKVTL